VAARERPIDRGTALGRRAVERTGAEIRLARVGAGLSIDTVAAAAGISNAEVSRLERALSPRVAVVSLAKVAAVVGLDLVVKTYPGGDPLRDAAQHRVLATFASHLNPALRWATEVPLPIAGDARAWDGLIAGRGWRFGVEVETQPNDQQGLIRRIRLKERDGQVDGVLLVLPDTRRTRVFLRAGSLELRAMFPGEGSATLARLRSGEAPEASSVVVVTRPRAPAGDTRGV
jgi:transcriptional regulator with XRE-family HTH domain